MSIFTTRDMIVAMLEFCDTQTMLSFLLTVKEFNALKTLHIVWRLRDVRLRQPCVTSMELLSLLPIQCLDLQDTRITDAGLACLARLPLQRLDLYGCEYITDVGIARLRRLPLQCLGLSDKTRYC